MELIKLQKRLKTAIKTAGGNKKVAEKSGIPIGTINNYLRGASEPTIQKIANIATVCSVSLDWLAYGTTLVSTQSTQSIDRKLMSDAIETAERILINTDRTMEPLAKAEFTLAIYDLLLDKSENKNDNILSLVKSLG